MYEFKIGDEVEIVGFGSNNGCRFIVTGTPNPSYIMGHKNGGWLPSSLKLVCPVGYRPVREDEMDESPKKGDAFFQRSDLFVMNTELDRSFRDDALADGDTWFRPLTTGVVKTGPAHEETPVVKEDNAWGWLIENRVGGMDMKETAAKAEAAQYSKAYQRDTLVFKIMGEYSTTCTTKWTPSGI